MSTKIQVINPNDLSLTQFQFGVKDNRPMILMIDDDPFQHSVVESILENENFQIQFALNYDEAIKILGTVKPKLILMDFMMPELDGIETTKRLKSYEEFKKVPVLMVTGNSDIDVVKRSIQAGAVGFLVKPFSRNTLLSKLQSLVSAMT
jgi:CheY-like chemotaxis protein